MSWQQTVKSKKGQSRLVKTQPGSGESDRTLSGETCLYYEGQKSVETVVCAGVTTIRGVQGNLDTWRTVEELMGISGHSPREIL